MHRFAFLSHYDDPDAWRAALRDELGGCQLDANEAVSDAQPYDFALAFRPPPGAIARLRGVRVLFSLGAGVDGLVDDPTIPPQLPIVRMSDPGLVRGMAEFVAHACLSMLREANFFIAMQREHRWAYGAHPYARERTVGILGLGAMGSACIPLLAPFGFPLLGWSRTPRSLAGIECFHGEAGLDALLARTDILVCLLPLTPQTRGILNARTFARLPRGASVINVGRGGHCVTPDLVAALDAGHLAAAWLDVFDTEPLPPGSPLWDHPKIRITPHVASVTHPRSAANYVAGQIRAMATGEPLRNLVERARGY